MFEYDSGSIGPIIEREREGGERERERERERESESESESEREIERERGRILLRSIVNMMIHVQIKITMWLDPKRPALRPWRSLAHRPPLCR